MRGAMRASSVGVFFARPLVGSRWTAGQGPLAQKTPTLLNLPLGPPAAAAGQPRRPYADIGGALKESGERRRNDVRIQTVLRRQRSSSCRVDVVVFRSTLKLGSNPSGEARPPVFTVPQPLRAPPAG